MNRMIRITLEVVAIWAALSLGVGVAWAQTGSDRFPQLTKETLNEEQRRVAAEITKQSSSGIGGPWNVMLRSPEMADRLTKLLDYLRFKTSLPLRLNELAIMITARHWSSQYEWWSHHRYAKKAGLSEAMMADLAQGKRPEGMQPDETAVYDFCTEMDQKHFVSDATFKMTKDAFGEKGVVDLIGVMSWYQMVSMLLNTDRYPLPDGVQPELKPLN